MIPLRYMGRLFEQIKQAVQEDRFLVGWHADERSKERGVTDWQIVSGFKEAELLPDGSEVTAINILIPLGKDAFTWPWLL